MSLIKVAKLNVMRMKLIEYEKKLRKMEERFRYNEMLYEEVYDLVSEIELTEEDNELINELNEIKMTNKKAYKKIKLYKRQIRILSVNVQSLSNKIHKERLSKRVY